MNEPAKRAAGDMENFLGNLLRTGVFLSASVMLVGGIIFLIRHGSELPQYDVFTGDSTGFNTLSDIFKKSISFRGRAFIQIGLLILIATPVIRVFVSMMIFARSKDWLYAIITSFVLITLLISLFHG